jgi:hypothetical protein
MNSRFTRWRKKHLNLILIWIFGATVIITAAAFMISELPDLSWSKPVKDAKVANFFAVVGSTATALTVFLLYRQLKLMNKQYEPKIIPLSGVQEVNVIKEKLFQTFSPALVFELATSNATVYNLKIRWTIKKERWKGRRSRGNFSRTGKVVTSEASVITMGKSFASFPDMVEKLLIDTFNWVFKRTEKGEYYSVYTRPYSLYMTMLYEDEDLNHYEKKFLVEFILRGLGEGININIHYTFNSLN